MEQDDGRRAESERGRAELLILQPAITEPGQSGMQLLGKAVARLALVQLRREELAECRILEPASRAQGALDPADLAQRRRQAVLLPVGGQLLPGTERIIFNIRDVSN